MQANERTFRCNVCPTEIPWAAQNCPGCEEYINPILANGNVLLSPKLDRGKRGAVIADQTYEVGNGGIVGDTRFDPAYLRKVSLLFDIADWPLFSPSGILPDDQEYGVDQLDADQTFLHDEHFLFRSRLELAISSGCHRVLEETVWDTFAMLDHRDRGQWTVVLDAQNNPTFPDLIDPEGGWALRFQNAIVLPGRDVPLESVLNFKERHKAELINLRRHIDSLSYEAAQGGIDSRRGHQLISDFESDLEEYTKKIVEGTNWSLGSFAFDIACNIATGATTQLGNHELKVGAIEALSVTPALKLVKSIFHRGIKTDTRSAPLAYILRAWSDLR